jgi:transposase
VSQKRATTLSPLSFASMMEATIEILPSVGQRIDSLSFADLRREARDWYDKSAYWKSQFEITKEREKKKDERINELEAEIRLWKQKFFGKKSEAKKKADKVKDDSSKEPPELPKSRGQQPGSPGHGRRDYDELDSIDEKNDLEEHEKLCACCGLPFEDKGLTHTTKIVEIEIKAHKRIITTPQYHKGCTCPETPAMIAAPPADRLIKGNNLGVSVWTELLLSKFCLHVPLSRILKLYSIHDFNLPVGTVTDGFRRIQPLFAPIVERVSKTFHYKMTIGMQMKRGGQFSLLSKAKPDIDGTYGFIVLKAVCTFNLSQVVEQKFRKIFFQKRSLVSCLLIVILRTKI